MKKAVIPIKTYKKELRKIMIDETEFFWVRSDYMWGSKNPELNDYCLVRCYSNIKSTYVDAYFPLGIMYYINPDQPYVIEQIIRYSISNNWDFTKLKQVFTINPVLMLNLIDSLKLDK